MRPLSDISYAVDPQTGCWVWQRSLTSAGYGNAWNGLRNLTAHRHFWLWARGQIPRLVIDHLCRNRACVNVDHMELVTQRENVLRGGGRPKKLTMEDAREIRGRLGSQRALAREYGVSQRTIGQIKRNAIWREF